MTIIASVLELGFQDMRALRVYRGDAYALHRVVYSLFDDVRTEEEKRTGSARSGFIWADKGGDAMRHTVLLLSTRAPKTDCVGRLQSRVVPDSFLSHRHYRFEIAINPARSKPRCLKPRNLFSARGGSASPQDAQGWRASVGGREAVAAWFAECAQRRWGFAVDRERLAVEHINVLYFRGKAAQQITLAQAHVTGALEVTDPAAFRRSFTEGIGRGKSFGCGLLQIAPLRAA